MKAHRIKSLIRLNNVKSVIILNKKAEKRARKKAHRTKKERLNKENKRKLHIEQKNQMDPTKHSDYNSMRKNTKTVRIEIRTEKYRNRVVSIKLQTKMQMDRLPIRLISVNKIFRKILNLPPCFLHLN